MKPYYEDVSVTLYHGDCREVLPGLGTFDLIVTDPPYGETSLAWDRWPVGWPALAAWKFSQDVVWEKHNGSNLAADRFSRVHENASHWYQGPWSEVYHEVPTTQDAVARTVRKKPRPAQWIGATGQTTYVSEDGGPRLMRSVIHCRSMHGRALHPTEKPSGVLEPLIEYGCATGGVVLDLFAGSGSTLAAAKATGRRAVGIEADERYCEVAAKRLAQDTLFGIA